MSHRRIGYSDNARQYFFHGNQLWRRSISNAAIPGEFTPIAAASMAPLVASAMSVGMCVNPMMRTGPMAHIAATQTTISNAFILSSAYRGSSLFLFINSRSCIRDPPFSVAHFHVSAVWSMPCCLWSNSGFVLRDGQRRASSGACHSVSSSCAAPSLSLPDRSSCDLFKGGLRLSRGILSPIWPPCISRGVRGLVVSLVDVVCRSRARVSLLWLVAPCMDRSYGSARLQACWCQCLPALWGPMRGPTPDTRQPGIAPQALPSDMRANAVPGAGASDDMYEAGRERKAQAAAFVEQARC